MPIIEHNMKLVFKVASRILILDNGEVVFHGQTSDVRDNPEILERYIGLGMA